MFCMVGLRRSTSASQRATGRRLRSLPSGCDAAELPFLAISERDFSLSHTRRLATSQGNFEIGALPALRVQRQSPVLAGDLRRHRHQKRSLGMVGCGDERFVCLV